MSEIVKVEVNTHDRFLTIIEKLSVLPDVDAKLDKILSMQIQWRDYQAKQDFSRAAATAQGRISLILRDKERESGPIKGNYASFDQMVLQSKDILAEYGLSISFREILDSEPGILHMQGIFRHVSGYHELYDLKVPYDTSSNKSAVWAKGSAITYAKKYLYSMILCLGTGDDDDGLVATNYVPKGISVMQKANLLHLIEQGESKIEILYRRYNVACVDDMTQSQYENACEELTKKIEALKATDAQIVSDQPENFLNV